MKEVWKDILGYEGLYQVSNLGDVKSLPKHCGNRPTQEKLCSQDWCRGYKRVCLCKNNVLKHKQVHRLVAQIQNNVIIAIFGSVSEAKKKTFINNISGCCRGVLKTAGGYKWKYTE